MEEVGATIRMIDDASPTVQRVDRQIDKLGTDAARAGQKAERGWKGFHLAMGALLAGTVITMGFRRLIASSDELRQKWEAWKDAVMDEGMRTAIDELGKSTGSLAQAIAGSANSAKGFSDIISPLIGFVGDGIKGWALAIAAVRGNMDEMVQSANELAEAEIWGKSTWKNELEFTKEELALLPSIIGLRKEGMKLSERENDLIERYAKSIRASAEDQKTMADFRKAALGTTGIVGEANEQEKLNATIEQYSENLRNADQWRDQWESDDYYDKIIKEKEALEKQAEAAAKVAENNKKIGDSAKLAYDELGEMFSAVKDSLQAVHDVMANEVIRIFDDWVDGQLKPAREYIKDIARELGNMALKAGMQMAFNVATSSLSSAAFAGGGIARGGIEIPSAASGMIVRGPQYIKVGDNEPWNEEAIVPMKNGKIPVESRGGGRRPIVVNISAWDSRSVAVSLVDNRSAVSRALREVELERGEY